MAYEAALDKSWKDLESFSGIERYSVGLLADKYDVDVKQRRIFSESCNSPAKDHLAILILHYLFNFLKKGYLPSGEWIAFKDVESGEIYYPAFREGAIQPILRKYGHDPEGIFNALGRFEGVKIPEGDAGIEIKTFDKVAVKIIMWKADEEFGPEATILFDKSLAKVLSMEDMAVFLRFVASSI